MDTKVSIIVPVYNIESVVGQCIESLINQTFSDIEILLVDDGSEDRSGKICDEYAMKDDRITVVHKDNGGICSSRNEGLITSKGRYIVYVDGDDWVDEDYVDNLMEGILKDRADISIACGYVSEGKNEIKKIYSKLPCGVYEGDILRGFFFNNMLSIREDRLDYGVHPFLCNKVFPREYLIKKQLTAPTDIIRGEDVICSYPALLMAKRISVVNMCNYHYRRWDGSETMRQEYEKIDSVVYRHYCLRNIFMKEELYEVLKPQMYVYYWHNLVNQNMELLFDEDKSIYVPFMIHRKDRVILYGAGKYGKRLYNVLKNFCEIVAWTDGRIKEQNKEHLIQAGKIPNYKYDKVVIGARLLSDQDDIKNSLVRMGVPERKIMTIRAVTEVMDYIEKFIMEKERELL